MLVDLQASIAIRQLARVEAEVGGEVRAEEACRANSVRTPLPPPYQENPFNFWHEINYNKLRVCTLPAFDYYIAPHLRKSNDASIAKIELYTSRIFSTLVLSRNTHSIVVDQNGVGRKVGDNLPSANIFTQDLRFTPQELEAYKQREDACGRGFQIDFQDTKADTNFEQLFAGEKSKKYGNKFQNLSSLSTHLGGFALRNVHTSEWRKRRAEGLPTLVACMKKGNALNPAEVRRPLNNPKRVVEQFMWGAPKFRFLLAIVRDVMFGKKKKDGHRKLVVFFQWPRSAEMFLKLVEFIGIRSVLVDADMKEHQQLKSIEQFNEEDDPKILISTYSLNIAGHDMQYQCATVVLAESAFNYPTEFQATSRVVRIGQSQPVDILRLFVEGTYQELQEACMLRKGAPMFAAYGALARARRELQESSSNLSASDIMAGALGLWRQRAQDPLNVQSTKQIALRKSQGAPSADEDKR
ncbi:P-loop containing nucleoside triphosphate hydrolase protein [Lophiotrema nucula]|uniref:P-loop containing nucleoside triphosphate hydrolase protein n=1 Tax=Lophiotrema nucula TaxID=690887 RepID=A0A6A5YUK6_9PLEO|nr:P-loop containing nucleoside triphosphate hydrolase protein [Lophiotrema nucula]